MIHMRKGSKLREFSPQQTKMSSKAGAQTSRRYTNGWTELDLPQRLRPLWLLGNDKGVLVGWKIKNQLFGKWCWKNIVSEYIASLSSASHQSPFQGPPFCWSLSQFSVSLALFLVDLDFSPFNLVHSVEWEKACVYFTMFEWKKIKQHTSHLKK